LAILLLSVRLPMTKYLKSIHCTLSPLFVAAGVVTAGAAPITPTYTTFGTLSGATFGGSGIPNNAVAITTIGDVTLGLTAHQRYFNPPVANDGAGTFTAVNGGDIYSIPPEPGYARWNFGWYVANAGTDSYLVELLYDFDPGTGTDSGNLGKIGSILGSNKTVQDSWNLGMAFLDTSTSPNVSPPAYPSFDPNASGQYSFALILRDAGSGAELGRAAINVNVVPDGGGTLAIFGLAMGAMAWFKRRWGE
jgi:hypothetical protein